MFKKCLQFFCNLFIKKPKIEYIVEERFNTNSFSDTNVIRLCRVELHDSIEEFQNKRKIVYKK